MYCPSTGDAWNFSDNPVPCLTPVGLATGVFASDDPQEPALGGTWTFTYKTNHCCARDITFSYGRVFGAVGAMGTVGTSPGIVGAGLAVDSGTMDTSGGAQDSIGDDVHIALSVRVAPSLESMNYKDGCALKPEKEDDEEESWFV